MHAFIRAFGRCLAVAGLLVCVQCRRAQTITLHGAVQFNDDHAFTKALMNSRSL